MSANLISNKVLSNSVIPLKSQPELITVLTTSTNYTIPNWYHSLTGILVSGGGGGGGSKPMASTFLAPNQPQDGASQGGGGGAVLVVPIPANPGDLLSVTLGAGGAAGKYQAGLQFEGQFGTQGGTSTLSINNKSFWSITGGAGAKGYYYGLTGYVSAWDITNGGTDGTRGWGAIGIPAGLPKASRGYGIVYPYNTLNYNTTFITSATIGSGLTGAEILNTSPLSSLVDSFYGYALQGLGSTGGQGGYSTTDNIIIYGGGGGGGAGQYNVGLGPVAVLSGDTEADPVIPVGLVSLNPGHGGGAALFRLAARDNTIVTYALGGGGGGGAGGKVNNTFYISGYDITLSAYNYFPGGNGGRAGYDSTVYYSGGSGGSLYFSTNSITVTSFTFGQDGFINTGGGGGGGSAHPTLSASVSAVSGGNGGSGIFILVGQRSYPFSGKPI